MRAAETFGSRKMHRVLNRYAPAGEGEGRDALELDGTIRRNLVTLSSCFNDLLCGWSVAIPSGLTPVSFHETNPSRPSMSILSTATQKRRRFI
jgi:hypothetical protein